MSSEAGPTLSRWTILGWALLVTGTAGLWLLNAEGVLQPLAAFVWVVGCLAMFLFLVGFPKHFGPLYHCELLRLGRRGRTIVLRVAYVTALLGMLWWVYQQWEGRFFRLGVDLFPTDKIEASEATLTSSDLGRLGESFVYGILLVQNLAVFVLTPAYLAGAIAEEREKKSLDLLLTTHLTAQEIVLGKLFARLTHLGGVLLAGLPVLSLVQLFGGVDIWAIAGNFYLTFMHLLALGSLSLAISAQANSSIGAVLTTYFVTAPILTCIGFSSGANLIGFLPGNSNYADYYRGLQHTMFMATLVEGVPAIIFLMLAAAQLRGQGETGPVLDFGPATPKAVLRDQETIDDTPFDMPPTPPTKLRVIELAEAKLPKDLAGLPYQLPPVAENSLLWKERYQGGPPVVASPLFWVLVVLVGSPFLMMLVGSLVYALQSGGLHNQFRALAGIISPGVYITTALYCLGAGMRAAGSVARERQQQTLDSLLCLPGERSEILWAKCLGTLLRGRGWLIMIGVMLLLELFVAFVPPGHVLAFVVLAALHLAFFITPVHLHESISDKGPEGVGALKAPTAEKPQP
jgi:ABC-type transport system involved in multi-copper enzyme maturation permease subunit